MVEHGLAEPAHHLAASRRRLKLGDLGNTALINCGSQVTPFGDAFFEKNPCFENSCLRFENLSPAGEAIMLDLPTDKHRGVLLFGKELRADCRLRPAASNSLVASHTPQA